MLGTTAKKGRPTVNKPKNAKELYGRHKADNTVAFNTKAKKRRAHEKFKARARRINRKKK